MNQWMDAVMVDDFTNVCANLKVLASICPTNKLCIVAKNQTNGSPGARTISTHRLNIDQRYGQFLYRYMTGDSRAETLSFIRHVLAKADEIAQSALAAEYKINHLSPLTNRPTYARVVSHGSSEEQPSGTANMPKPDLFALSPKHVMDVLKTNLEAALKGIEHLQTTYKTDVQMIINVKIEIIDPAEQTIRNISKYFTDVS